MYSHNKGYTANMPTSRTQDPDPLGQRSRANTSDGNAEIHFSDLLSDLRNRWNLERNEQGRSYAIDQVDDMYLRFVATQNVAGFQNLLIGGAVIACLFIASWVISDLQHHAVAISSFALMTIVALIMSVILRSTERRPNLYFEVHSTCFLVFGLCLVAERIPDRTEISLVSLFFVASLFLTICRSRYEESRKISIGIGAALLITTVVFGGLLRATRVIIPYILSTSLSLYELKNIEKYDRKVFETIMILEDNLEQIQRQRSKIMRLLADSMPKQHRNAFIHEPWTLTHLPALSETTILTIRFRWLKRKDLEKYKTLFKLSGEIHEKIVALSRKFGITRVKSQGTWMMFCNKVTEEDGSCRPSDLCRFASEVVECSNILVSALSRHVTFQAGIATGPALSGVVDCSRRVFDLIGESAERSMHLSRMANTGDIYIDEPTSNFVQAMENFSVEKVQGAKVTYGERRGRAFKLKLSVPQNDLPPETNSMSNSALEIDQEGSRQTAHEIYKQLVVREVIKSRKSFLKVFPHYEFDEAKEQEFLKYMSESESISRLRATALYLVFASLLHGFVHLIVYDQLQVPLRDWQSFFIISQYYILLPILFFVNMGFFLIPNNIVDHHQKLINTVVYLIHFGYMAFAYGRLSLFRMSNQYILELIVTPSLMPVLTLELLDVIRNLSWNSRLPFSSVRNALVFYFLWEVFFIACYGGNLGLLSYFSMFSYFVRNPLPPILFLYLLRMTKERINRQKFLLQTVLVQKNVYVEHEVEVAEQTLFSIVPKELYDLIVSKSSPYEHHSDAIIACINFAHYHLLLSSARDDAFSFLKEIYERIEVLCQVHQVRFLKSTGQNFHIAKVVTDSAQDAFHDVVRFSFQILELCKCLKLQARNDLERTHLGAQAYITRGEVCCGMIGNKVLVFDVTGHAVEDASVGAVDAIINTVEISQDLGAIAESVKFIQINKVQTPYPCKELKVHYILEEKQDIWSRFSSYIDWAEFPEDL